MSSRLFEWLCLAWFAVAIGTGIYLFLTGSVTSLLQF